MLIFVNISMDTINTTVNLIYFNKERPHIYVYFYRDKTGQCNRSLLRTRIVEACPIVLVH